MAYLGNDLQVAYPTYKNIDDISGSFNSSTTSFPLRVNGVAPVPPPLNSQQCLISVGGVVQRPDDSGSEGFRLSGGNIIFASAPTTGADFFGVILAGADYVNAGANFPSGSAAVPSITFDSDIDTGIFNPAANEIGFSTGGTQRLSISSAGQLSNNLGTAGAPSYSFTGDVNTGIYSPGADQVAISTNGTGRLFVDSSGRVGIGTSSPADTNSFGGVLDLSGSQGGALYVRNQTSASKYGAFGFYDTDIYVTTYATGNIRFNTGSSGAERMRITSAGNVGIGTATVNSLLEVRGTTDGQNVLHLSNSAGTSDGNVENQIRVTCGGNSYWGNLDIQAYQTIFTQNGGEKARIDPNGRLLVGTSTGRDFYKLSGYQSRLLIEQNDLNTASYLQAALVLNDDSNEGPNLGLGKSRGTTAGSNTIVVNGDSLGAVYFFGADGAGLLSAASIRAEVDGTPGTNDMPGRLVFSTTADGASSPTERMRISQNGSVSIEHGNNTTVAFVGSSNASYTADILFQNCARAANSSYQYLVSYSGNYSDLEFKLRGDGSGFCDGSWNGGGADYAEYFEWSDSNPDAEDRRGISVVLDGDKIREAQAGEDPIGVISGNPSVVGDSAWNKWSGKYLRDEFGTYIQEDYKVTDDDGNTVIQQRRKLNPDYDSQQPYQSREERPEWGCVGLMGKLRIRKGQITGSRWIKMRDISDSVEEWLVR